MKEFWSIEESWRSMKKHFEEYKDSCSLEVIILRDADIEIIIKNFLLKEFFKEKKRVQAQSFK